MTTDCCKIGNLDECLNRLRLRNSWCDITLQIGEKCFPAHKLVLMSRSEYFRAMFTADMREKEESTIKLDDEIIDSDIFTAVLEYFYTSKITFTSTNFEQICKVAAYLCFDNLLIDVENYMKSDIKLHSVANYLGIAKACNLKNLQYECEQFIIVNSLLEIAKNELLPSVSYEQLLSLLERMNNLVKHEDMFKFSIEWILIDKTERSAKLLDLLKIVGMKNLSLKFLKEIVSVDSLVCDDKDCLLFTIKEFTMRSSIDILYILGGKTSVNKHAEVYKFSSITPEWIRSSDLPARLNDFGCTAIGQEIYVCGGIEGQDENPTNHLRVFKVSTGQWRRLDPMENPRYACRMAVLNGHIYVAGGQQCCRKLSVVERYSVEKDEWEEVSPMINHRAGLELVELNGSLYAIGGQEDGGEILNTAERYDPEKNEWKLIAEMNNAFAWFGCAVLNNRIYIAGTRNCEVYHPEKDEWFEIAAPVISGERRRLAVFNDKLLTIGGKGGTEQYINEQYTNSMNSIEYYDVEVDNWVEMTPMEEGRWNHGVAVVKSESFL